MHSSETTPAAIGDRPFYRDDDLTLICTWDRSGLVVSGEIDAANAVFVAAATVEAAAMAQEILVDVGGLTFTDLAGVRALLAPAEREIDPVTVVLLDPPPILERVLHLGWSTSPQVQVRRSAAR